MGNPGNATDLAKHDWVLAIDPGASGGIARLWGTGELETWRMPTEAQGGKLAFIERIFEVFTDWRCVRVVLENVWGREGDGKRQITTFMKHVGFLEGVVLSALRDKAEPPDVVWVAPTKWQKALGCPKAPTKAEEPKAGRRKTIHKNRLKDFAHETFPGSKFTLCTCDAALLAEWGRRTL